MTIAGALCELVVSIEIETNKGTQRIVRKLSEEDETVAEFVERIRGSIIDAVERIRE